MEYRLNITDDFNNNLDYVIGYIYYTLDNPPASEHLAQRVRKTIRNIHENPFQYPLYHDEEIAAKGYRYAVVSNYLIFYIVDEASKVIYIAHFLYGKQDLTSNLD